MYYVSLLYVYFTYSYLWISLHVLFTLSYRCLFMLPLFGNSLIKVKCCSRQKKNSLTKCAGKAHLVRVSRNKLGNFCNEKQYVINRTVFTYVIISIRRARSRASAFFFPLKHRGLSRHYIRALIFSPSRLTLAVARIGKQPRNCNSVYRPVGASRR